MRRLVLIYIATAALLCSCAKGPEQQDNAQGYATTTQARSTVDAGLDTSVAALSTNADSAPLVTFGFTDTSGSRVLVTPPETLSIAREMLAFTGSQSSRPLTLTRMQHGSPADNGRQIAENFDNIKGFVFQVPPPFLAADQTVLLVNKRFLKTRTPLAVTAVTPPAILDAEMLSAIGEKKALKARRGWCIATLPAKRSVNLVEFYPQGDTVLLSLVLIGPDAFVWEDYPGETSDESSVWRVDDGGEVEPNAFKIIAAFDSAGTISLARAWAGPEGENAALLRQNSTRFEEEMSCYRYWSPE